MGLKKLLLRTLTWWNGQTVGTWLYTFRKGVKVGQDDQGNIYYKNADDKKRWVIFNGETDASRVPPDWRMWLHGLLRETPENAPLPVKKWEKTHSPNLTGTDNAYAPPGSLYRRGKPKRAAVSGDYEAWKPSDE